MRVVIAPTRFAGTLTAGEAAEAMHRGWSGAAPHDELVLVPMSDGGPGFLDVVSAAHPTAETLAATVADPFGRPVPAAVLVVDDERSRTAYVEAAQACGPDLVAPGARDPGRASSAGVGQLLDLALSTSPTRVVVGLGSTASHDGGAGMLSALGAGRPESLGAGGLALAGTAPGDLTLLTATVERLRGVDLVVATPETLPLLGFQGASATEAEPRGASPAQAQALESALGHWVEVVRRVRPERTDLLSGATRRLDKEPGAGAGGGLAYGLFVLGARRVDGPALVAQLVGLREALAGAGVTGLVVTGEGTYDWRSLRDSAPAAVADLAMATGVPAVVLAGQVRVGRREAMTAGMSGTYAVCDRPDQVESAMADPEGTLAARAARVAGTWSPAPRPRA